MKVKLKTIEAFEAIGPTGTVTKLQQVGPEWNHMIELQTPDGQKLVLMRDGQRGLNLMALVTGNNVTDWSVIAGSPDLLDKLGLLVAHPDRALLDVMEAHRQRVASGHTPAEDDRQSDGALAKRAAQLLAQEIEPGDRRRELVDAIVWALAELQRFDRREAWKRNQPRPAQDAAGNPEGGNHG